VIFRARHLQEDTLFECYLAEQSGEPVEPPSAEHLTDCSECRARYSDLGRFMDALRTEADSELDEIFPAERQRAQQQQIARRIEHLGQHARVISFPNHAAGHPAPMSATRALHAWVSAAAAAGLFIGIGLGTVYYSHAPGARSAAMAMRSIAAPSEVAAAPAADTSPAPAPVLGSSVNDQFLSELELALERPHTPELVALDELTPHVREVQLR
jgi:anti-sigma factor RsiW